MDVSERLDLAGETQAIWNIGGIYIPSHTVQLRLRFGYKLLEPRRRKSAKHGVEGFYPINNREDKTFWSREKVLVIGILIGANLEVIIAL